MKKIKIILLMSVLLLYFGLNFNKVEAAGGVTLTSNMSSAYIGDEFTVSVNVSGMSVATLTIKINVDTSKVDYVSGPGNSNFTNGRVIYTWTDPNGGASPITSGTIATFKFKAKQAGTASFSVSGEFYDSNENTITPSFSGTSVILQEKTVTPPSSDTGNNNNNNQNTGSGSTGSSGGQTNSGSTSRRTNKFTVVLVIRGVVLTMQEVAELLAVHKPIIINQIMLMLT